MKSRVLGIAFLLSVAGIFASAQQSPGQGGDVRKERTYDVPTPGVLVRPLLTEPVVPPFELSGAPAVAADGWDLDAATGAYYRRGELLVRFKQGASQSARAQALLRSGASRLPDMLPNNWERVALGSAERMSDATAALRQSGTVDEVSLNYRVSRQQFVPNDAEFRLQWNFEAIDLPDAWQINPGGKSDVIVAVVDTGMNTVNDTVLFSNAFIGQVAVRFSQVPDLFADGRISAPFDFVYRDTLPFDLEGHGTHVAGTIAQLTNNNIGVAGIAYNVRLMPVKVLSDTGSWDDVFFPTNMGGAASVIAEGIRYAADNGAKIINLSLGGTGPMSIVRDAIQYAVGKGAFVAIAAGNGGDTGNPTEYPAAYAADIAGVMAVGAVNRSLKRADYSGFKPYVDICAPGGEMNSEFDYEGGVTQVTYQEAASLTFLSFPDKLLALRLGLRPTFDRFQLVPFQGTSMATPHISGVAALLYSQGIRSPAQIEQAIKRFATPIAATADECGAGLVDPRRALRGLGLSR